MPGRGPADDRVLPRAEWAGSLFVAGLRVATLAQMLPSVATAISVSEHRGLAALSWVLAVGAVTGIAVVALVRRRPPSTRWAAADVAVAVVVLLLGLLTVPLEYRTGSWVGFQGAYSLSVASALIGVRDRRTWGALLALLVAARLVYLLPTVDAPAEIPTVIGELFTLLGLAPLAWLGTGFVYRIAQDADRDREYAARLAREAEERRARAAIHNGAALMKLLVDQAGGVSRDGTVPTEVWVQAQAELNRMRAYLAGHDEPSGRSQELTAVLDEVAAEFTDLPLDIVSDLARGVRLGAERDGVATAVRSVLINVRQHARATRVVVHAEAHERGTGWTVTVHDDGVGFDPATTAFGVGLRDLAVEQLAVHGITTTIDSHPGLGTTVTMTTAAEGAR